MNDKGEEQTDWVQLIQCLEYQSLVFDICLIGIGQPLEVFKSLGSQIIVIRILIWQQITSVLKEVYSF